MSKFARTRIKHAPPRNFFTAHGDFLMAVANFRKGLINSRGISG